MISLRKIIGRAALVLASVLGTLGMVEIAIRAAGLAPLPDSSGGGFRPEHPLLRLLKPNVCHDAGAPQGAYFVEVCTNLLGLRDRDHSPSETPRVLGIGDSFTFGWGNEQDDTFLAHLERALRLAMPDVKPGVFNAGLSYTSQAHQDVLLRHLYSQIRPDLVVLAFAEDNDIDENIIWNPNIGVFPEQGEISKDAVQAYREALRGEVFRDFLFRHSALVRFFRQRTLRASVAAEIAAVDARLAAHGLVGAPLDRMVSDEARRRFLQTFSHRYDDDWQVTEILLERIRSFVAEKGGKLVLMRIPSRLSVEDPSWNSARVRFCGADVNTTEKTCGTLDRAHTARRLREYATRHGLVYVDPEKELRAASEHGEDVYLPQDIHLSRLGHLRVGERLAEVVVPLLGGKSAHAAQTKAEPPGGQRLVGAYWYPWYRALDWSSFTDYSPKRGQYISTDRDAIARQIQAAERGEIDFFVIELLAEQNPESRFNNDAVNAMVSAIDERRRRGYSHMKFAILSDIFVGETEIGTPERWLEATRHHLDRIWTQYVEPYRDAYVQVDGKPLVGIFSPDLSIKDARFTIVRPYWVSHEQWRDWDRKQELLPFWDTYPQTVTDRRFVSVVPGYNDWRLERRPQVGPYLPRMGGRTFVEQWRRVFEVHPEVVLVYSFNEYFEQTQIEPTVEQGDRYLVLNQLLARRFKDGRDLTDTEGQHLADILEPPAAKNEEKAAWLAIDDPRVTSKGLDPIGKGRAALRDQAEVEFDVDSEQAFVVALAHTPSFERCARISITVAGADPKKTGSFATELTQLSILRDHPLQNTVKHVELLLKKIPAFDDCKDSGQKPIVLTGITRYPLATAERMNFRPRDVTLEGFWDIEVPQSGGPFVWSRGDSTITISRLSPGVRHRVTLSFRDTAGFGNVDVGPDPKHLQSLVITPGHTVTLPTPLTVAPDGKLRISLSSATWKPSERFGSKDLRSLGVALRLITLDRVEGVSSPHERR